MRPLSAEESALWARVASTIRPLSRDRSDEEAGAEKAAVLVRTARKATSSPAVSAPKYQQKRVPGTTLDSSWDRRLRSGSVEPDRTVDLHGMNLDGAWQAIDRSLEQAIGRGERVLLLITGHHRSGEQPIRRGAIRAAVHDWLAASRHAGDIAAVRAAHRRHGGGGSLYIVLRRTQGMR